jgi:hypothetical protein
MRLLSRLSWTSSVLVIHMHEVAEQAALLVLP